MENILLLENSGLRGNFYNALKKEGFQVTDFFGATFPSFEKSQFHRIGNVFYRAALGRKDYMEIQKRKFLEKQYNQSAQDLFAQGKKFDYALIFRGDRFPNEMLSILRKMCRKIICYEYDGLKVCGNIFNTKSFFDRTFVFDPADYFAHQEIFLPLTNCWFETPDLKPKQSVENDIFYIGVGVPERLRIIEKVKDYCIHNSIILNATLTIAPHFVEKKGEGIFLSHKTIDYQKNVEGVQKSKAILDFKLSYHNGLSFRFFEGMKYRKKIITNNASVKHYDFYHPDNVFITDFQNLDGLKEFLEKPYHEIDEKIFEKYGFKNWIHYALDILPYQKIDLPKI